MRPLGETTWARGDAFCVAQGGGREPEPESSFSFTRSVFRKSHRPVTRICVLGMRSTVAKHDISCHTSLRHSTMDIMSIVRRG